MNGDRSTLRMLTSEEDFAAYLRLRARVWGSRENPSDLNAYDRHAMMLGAFDADGRLHAALRVVTPGRDSPDLEPFRRAVARHGLGGQANLEGPLPRRIAAEESFPLTSILDGLERDARRYVEIGRLMRAEHPGDPWAVPRLMKHAFAESKHLGYRCAIAMCTVAHLRPWSRYGFERVPGMPKDIERYSGVESVPVWAGLE